MTVISSIICKDGIVMASDSRTTKEDGTVRDDTPKIFTIKLSDGHECLVAQSGNADLGGCAIEAMAFKAKEKTLNDYRVFPELAENAVADLKLKIRKQFHGSPPELQTHFEHHDFSLMIAFYVGVIQHLYTLDFSLGAATPKRVKSFSIGCGANLADFLLDWIDLSDVEVLHGIVAAIYAVEETKKADARCGGPTQLGTLFLEKDGTNYIALGEKQVVDAVVAALVKMEEGLKSAWKDKMQIVLSDIAKSIC